MQEYPRDGSLRSGSPCSAACFEASPRRYRLAAVFHRPHPYFCKFFQHLAAHPQIDLTVYFYSDFGVGATFDPGYEQSVQWDTDLLHGYKHQFLRNYSPWPDLGRYVGLIHPGVIPALGRGYDAVLIHGWWGFSTTLAVVSALARHTPLLLHSDRNVSYQGGGRRWLRNSLKRAVFREADAFLVVGQRNAAFYRELGVPEKKMFLVPFAVDNQFYQGEARRLIVKRDELRRKHALPPMATVILSVSRLSPEKGLQDLLTAFAQLPTGSAHLVLVGDGPQRGSLEQAVRPHCLPFVHFAGFRNYTETPEYYASSDVFVLPSHRDAWGVVINEAMNFGLPVVASHAAGAVADLVEPGVNGFLFPAGDVDSLTNYLGALIHDPETRARMGRESAQRISGWNFDRGVEGVLAALDAVASRKAAHK